MAAFAEGALISQYTSTATAGGTTTLTVASTTWQRFTGTAAQTVVLPDATTMRAGREFQISNESTGTITVQFDDNSAATTIAPSNQRTLKLFANGTSNGTWNISEMSEHQALPLELSNDAATPLVIDIGNIVVEDLVSGNYNTIPPIGGTTIPSFASGTVTIPTTSGGNAVPSVGSNLVITISANQYLKMRMALNSSGDIVLTTGTEGATEAAATLPVATDGTHDIGYYVLQDIAGTIQNISADKLYQFAGGGSGGGGSNSGYAKVFVSL